MASALVLMLVTLTTLFIGGYVFAAVVSAVFAGVYREWDTMVTRSPLSPKGMILIALVAISGLVFPALGPVGTMSIIGLAALVALAMRGEAAIWRAGGLIFIGLVLVAVLVMRGSGIMGFWAGLFLGTVVWMTDSAAFFTGRQVGGEKLAPGISPSKTWSGALGGLALGSIAGLVVWILVTDSPWWIGLSLALSISVLGQLGDLCESAVKRHFRIKDSGDIIPGHGGLMDRLDSLTLSVLFVTLAGLAHAGVADVATGLLVW